MSNSMIRPVTSKLLPEVLLSRGENSAKQSSDQPIEGQNQFRSQLPAGIHNRLAAGYIGRVPVADLSVPSDGIKRADNPLSAPQNPPTESVAVALKTLIEDIRSGKTDPSTLSDDIQDLLDAIGDKLESVFPDLSDKISGFDGLADNITNLAFVILGGGSPHQIEKAVEQLTNSLANALKPFFKGDPVAQDAIDVATHIADGLEQLIEGAVEKNPTDLKNGIDALINAIDDAVKKFAHLSPDEQKLVDSGLNFLKAGLDTLVDVLL